MAKNRIFNEITELMMKRIQNTPTPTENKPQTKTNSVKSSMEKVRQTQTIKMLEQERIKLRQERDNEVMQLLQEIDRLNAYIRKLEADIAANK